MSNPHEQPPRATPSGPNVPYMVGGALVAVAANAALFFGVFNESNAGFWLPMLVTFLVGAFLLAGQRGQWWGAGALIGGCLVLIVGAGASCTGALG